MVERERKYQIYEYDTFFRNPVLDQYFNSFHRRTASCCLQHGIKINLLWAMPNDSYPAWDPKEGHSEKQYPVGTGCRMNP